jgi:hypothetical protein
VGAAGCSTNAIAGGGNSGGTGVSTVSTAPRFISTSMIAAAVTAISRTATIAPTISSGTSGDDRFGAGTGGGT